MAGSNNNDQCSASVVKPLLITVAPNGARLTKKDHPQLPESPQELAHCALACQQAGAAMLHMHARDQDGCHTLDVETNQRFLEVVRQSVGSDMVIQLTTESIGKYSPEEQMALVRHCQPEAVSIALRELVPSDEYKSVAQDFFAELKESLTISQFIIYSVADLDRYYQLFAEQIIPVDQHHLLFVIGRHQQASDKALLEILVRLNSEVAWSVCAFGQSEYRLTAAAMALNGDIRVGFENNRWDVNGNLAETNTHLVMQAANLAKALNRPLLTANQFRSLMLSTASES
jgi:3-keto-5-aminohexanoate cleavage enzyme